MSDEQLGFPLLPRWAPWLAALIVAGAIVIFALDALGIDTAVPHTILLLASLGGIVLVMGRHVWREGGRATWRFKDLPREDRKRMRRALRRGQPVPRPLAAIAADFAASQRRVFLMVLLVAAPQVARVPSRLDEASTTTGRVIDLALATLFALAAIAAAALLRPYRRAEEANRAVILGR